MKIRHTLIITAMLSMTLILGACATRLPSTIIDGSTAESTRLSIIQMTRNLSPRKRTELVHALIRIQYSDANSAFEVVQDLERYGQTNYELLKGKLDGLNYAQIIALAAKSPTIVQPVK